MTDSSLHPRLCQLAAKYQGLLRLLSMALFLTISGGMIAMMAIAFTSGDFFNLLLLGGIGLLMMPLVALLSWLLRYLDRGLSRQLDRANQLLRENQPLSARLAPTGLNSKMGTLVTLHPVAGKPAPAGPVHALINPSFRWSRPPRQETTVELYCQELKPDHELVALQADGGALLGKLVTLEAYQRQMRLTRIALTILLALLLVVFGVLVSRS
jgi:hypothetical protein